MIDWDDVPEAQRYQVKIYDGWSKIIHTSDYLNQSTYTVPAENIEFGRTYSYMLFAYAQPVQTEVNDNYSINALFPSERPHFTLVETGDTDGDGLPDDLENTMCTDSFDADTDDDGIPDGAEDANQDGNHDSGETNPCDPDSDDDGLQDGKESGYTLSDIGPDTDPNFFEADLEPTTTTNPNDPDSDDDGFSDGFEVSAGTDPNNPDEYPSVTSLNLDGYEDYAWAPHSGSLDISGNQVTMEAMVRLDGHTGNHWIVCKQNIDFKRSYEFYIGAIDRRIFPSIHADWFYTMVTIKADFHSDGDFDGNDFVLIADQFGRTDCNGDCYGDFDGDGDVDEDDLAVFAASFGRNDFPSGP